MFSPIQGQALLLARLVLEVRPAPRDQWPLSAAQVSADAAPDDWSVAKESEPKSGAALQVSEA